MGKVEVEATIENLSDLFDVRRAVCNLRRFARSR